MNPFFTCYTHLLTAPLLGQSNPKKETYTRSNPNTESKDSATKPEGVVSAYSFRSRWGQKKLGEKWTALDSAAKSPYVHMHEEDKKRHIMCQNIGATG
jgi:hypothetical protein